MFSPTNQCHQVRMTKPQAQQTLWISNHCRFMYQAFSSAFYQAPHLLSVATSWSKPAISSVLMTAWNFTQCCFPLKWRKKLRPVAVQSFSMLQGRSFWWQLEFHPADWSLVHGCQEKSMVKLSSLKFWIQHWKKPSESEHHEKFTAFWCLLFWTCLQVLKAYPLYHCNPFPLHHGKTCWHKDHQTSQCSQSIQWMLCTFISPLKTAP